MTLPGNASAETVDLHTVAEWSVDDLEEAKGAELKTILSRIKAEAYLGGTQHRKYWAYSPAVGGTKAVQKQRITSPEYKANKGDREVMATVLAEAEECVQFGQHGNWILRTDSAGNAMSGEQIDHWLFAKNVIEPHMPQGKGNPFNVFKIDSRKKPPREMWISDVCVRRCKQGGEKYIFFSPGFFDHFKDFETRRPNKLSLQDVQTEKIRTMNLMKEAEGEGFSFSVLFHIARNEILEFLGVEKSAREETVFINSHRRQGPEGQKEIDGIFAWESTETQHRTHAEVKSNKSATYDWSGGFSNHQMREVAELVADRVVSPKKKIQSIYVRIHRDIENETWFARLDLYNSGGDFIRQLDIFNLPN